MNDDDLSLRQRLVTAIQDKGGTFQEQIHRDLRPIVPTAASLLEQFLDAAELQPSVARDFLDQLEANDKPIASPWIRDRAGSEGAWWYRLQFRFRLRSHIQSTQVVVSRIRLSKTGSGGTLSREVLGKSVGQGMHINSDLCEYLLDEPKNVIMDAGAFHSYRNLCDEELRADGWIVL